MSDISDLVGDLLKVAFVVGILALVVLGALALALALL